MRILIVAHDFPPLNTSAARRPYSWAKTWASLGHDVEVVTTRKYRFDGWPGYEVHPEGFRLREVAYLPRAIAFGHSTVAEKPARILAFIREKTAKLRTTFGPFAQPTMLAYGSMLRASLASHRELPFDVVISTSGPEVCTIVGHGFAKHTGVPWIADYRDLWFREFGMGRNAPIAWLTGALNRRLLRRAAAVSTVSEGLANHLSAMVKCPVWVSYNGFSIEPRRPSAHRTDSTVRLVYTGRLYPEKRDLQLLFCGMRELARDRPELSERLRLEIYGPSSDVVRAQVREYGLGAVVHDHGFVSYEESIAAQAGADALLFLDWADPRAKGVLTSKLFEYFAARRPILSVGAVADTEAALLISSVGAGIVCSDINSVKDALEDLVEGRLVCDPSPAIAQYSREEQARRLLVKIEALAHSRCA